MRKILLATAAMAGLATATPAMAQRVWQNGRWVVMPHQTQPSMMPPAGQPRMMQGNSHQGQPAMMQGYPHQGQPPMMRGNPHQGQPPMMQGYPHQGQPPMMRGNPHQGQPRMMHNDHQRWGGTVGGRWEGGMRAPGGWNAYHRLHRGSTLPGYWMGSNFRIYDYLDYGLGAPPQGYGWVRYYDDAVLVDGGGRVWDSIDGISWADAEADSGYGWAESSASASVDAGYPPIAPEGYYDGPPPPVVRPAPLPPRAYAPAPYIAPAPYVMQAPAPCVQVCGAGAWQGGSYGAGTTVYSTGGYGTTTVVVLPAVTTTTTTITEEVIEESVVTKSYVRRPAKRVLRKYRPRCTCR